MRENIAEGIRTVLAELAFRASVTLDDETLENLRPAVLERVGPGRRCVRRWRAGAWRTHGRWCC